MVAGLEDITGGVMRIGDRIVNHVPSRDRDIAMVFQSYALYPHLTVYDNIAFGLKIKKLPKEEIERRVAKAAGILGLEPFLKRKPRALSGGQRQRVAMGRAIVREPAAFLMDEPLSNLDAKLRVQMRAEIAGIQRDLGVTTIYVTHDQVEAMTMGDRVAVMRKGELQQVADPQTLYDRPVNLFVGGFIGSPAMNMIEATFEQRNGGYVANLGEQALEVGAETLQARPGAGRLRGPPRRARDPPRGPPGRRARARHAGRPAAAGHDRAHRGARLGDHGPLLDQGQARRDRGCSRAGAGRRRRADRGTPGRAARRRRSSVASAPVRAPVRASRSRSPSTRARFISSTPSRDSASMAHHRRNHQRKESHREEPLRAQCRHRGNRSPSSSRSSRRRAAARSARDRVRKTADVSGTITFDGIWTASSGQTQFQDVIAAFNKIYPNVHVDYKPVGNNLPTVLATAVAGGHPPDMADIAQPGTVAQLAQEGKLKPITYATSRDQRRTSRPAWRQLGTFDGKLYALVFKAANKSLVWYNVPAFKAAGISPPKTWAQLLKDAQTLKASGVPAYSIGGADGWTLTDLFENIYLRTFGPAKYDQLSPAQDQVDRPVGDDGAEDDGAGHR